MCFHTVYFYCFVYVYVFLLVLSVLPPSDNPVAFNNNNNNNNNNNKVSFNFRVHTQLRSELFTATCNLRCSKFLIPTRASTTDLATIKFRASDTKVIHSATKNYTLHSSSIQSIQSLRLHINCFLKLIKFLMCSSTSKI
jgi:hypothetical protein